MSTLATASNGVYLSNGPTGTLQQLVASTGGTGLELAYIGTASWVGNGSAVTATLNYIDGTAALPFTPTAILAVRSGQNTGAGNALDAAGTPVTAVDAANANKTATVTFGAAPTNNANTGIIFMIFR
jgi:hypothetical protein